MSVSGQQLLSIMTLDLIRFKDSRFKVFIVMCTVKNMTISTSIFESYEVKCHNTKSSYVLYDIYIYMCVC